MILEACVETREEARRAEQLGASRLEVCANLNIGGTTPSVNLVEQILNEATIPVKVMIRPRGGNFVYTEHEILVMINSMKQLKYKNLDGFVIGALTAKKEIDMDLVNRLCEEAGVLKVTFHKAIDLTADPAKATKKLIKESSINSILTSGGMPTAMDGALMIRRMLLAADDKVKIIAAGRITNYNLAEVREATTAIEFHGRRIVGNLS